MKSIERHWICDLPALNYAWIAEDEGCNRRPHQASIQVVACATREPHFKPHKLEHDNYPYVSLHIFHSAAHTVSPRIHFSLFSSMSLFTSSYSYCFMHDSFSLWLVRRCGAAAADSIPFACISSLFFRFPSVDWHPKDWGETPKYLLLLRLLTYELPSFVPS